MHHVPVGSRHHYHIVDAYVFVEHVVRRRSARTAGGDDACRGLEAERLAGGIEDPVERGDSCAVGRGIMHGRAEHVAVGLLEPFGYVRDAVVAEHAPVPAVPAAAAAAYAAAHSLVAEPDYLALHALIFKFVRYYPERGVGAAVPVGTAVEHHHFHI